MFLHITSVQYLSGYKLKLIFNNGAHGTIDLEPELYGEVFEPLRDKSLFKQVRLTSRTIEWPNGADFAPEFLYEQAKITTMPRSERPEVSAWRWDARPAVAFREPASIYHTETEKQ